MLNDFDFELPQELIAQEPLPRGTSRLLCNHDGGGFIDTYFEKLLDILIPGDLLILNNTKVIPAFLRGITNENADVTVNLISQKNNMWGILSKPRKKLKLGTKVEFSCNLIGTVIEKQDDLDVMQFNLQQSELYDELQRIGQMPLPPYIKRLQTKDDSTTYQTVFSQINGSVAAPTAGLHFTENILQKLQDRGVKIAYITLHVGGGTFLPVRNIESHKMHSEFYSIDKEVCDAIHEAKEKSHRVIAVGTTVLRTLESAANFCIDGDLHAHSNYTNLFIRNHYNFKIVDALLTNFHLPKSTLFMLVCAFLGSTEKGQALYKHAIENRYRFFSYGDACFLTQK